MAEALSNSPGDSQNSLPTTPSFRSRWQVGLRTLCLLVVAIAVWTAVFVNRQQNASLEARIAAMRPLARELVVDDPKQAAIVKLEELWMGDHQWELYLPEGRYRLCLATNEIDQKGLAPVVKSGLLRGGRHRIALEQVNLPQPKQGKAGARVTVRWDQAGQLGTEEPPGWDTGSSQTTEGGYTLSTQLPADRPLILHRCQFLEQPPKKQTTGPKSGILLWIEPATPADE